MGVEQTIGSGVCLILASVYLKKERKKEKVEVDKENKKEVVSIYDDGREAKDVLSGALVLVLPV